MLIPRHLSKTVDDNFGGDETEDDYEESDFEVSNNHTTNNSTLKYS